MEVNNSMLLVTICRFPGFSNNTQRNIPSEVAAKVWEGVAQIADVYMSTTKEEDGETKRRLPPA